MHSDDNVFVETEQDGLVALNNLDDNDSDSSKNGCEGVKNGEDIEPLNNASNNLVPSSSVESGSGESQEYSETKEEEDGDNEVSMDEANILLQVSDDDNAFEMENSGNGKNDSDLCLDSKLENYFFMYL